MGDDKTKWSNVIIWPWESSENYKSPDHSRVVRQENKLFKKRWIL